MLSTVGTHLGPGRTYSHPFPGPSGVPSLLPPSNITTLPPILNTSLVNMSTTEFARPHPKPRSITNNLSIRNGIISSNSGSKFSEQNSPVNLAVTNSQMPQQLLSPKDERMEIQTKAEHHSTNASSLYSPTRIPYGTNNVQNTYREIDYSSLYGRPGGMYGAPNLYLSNSRNQVHHRPYLQAQIDSYNYLQTYNPPSTLGHMVQPQLPNISSPAAPIAPLTLSTQQQNGGNGLILNPSLSPSSLPLISKSTKSLSPISSNLVNLENTINHRHHSLPSALSSGRNKSDKSFEEIIKDISQSTSSNGVCVGGLDGRNSKHVGFKVPSGKEGSMKHRILTRPYGEKNGIRRKSPNSIDKYALVR